MKLTALANIQSIFGLGRKIPGDDEITSYSTLDYGIESVLTVDQNTIDIEANCIATEQPITTLHFCDVLLDRCGPERTIRSVGPEVAVSHFRRNDFYVCRGQQRFRHDKSKNYM